MQTDWDDVDRNDTNDFQFTQAWHIKGAPVSEPKEVLAKIPMILCESEPGNNLISQKLKNH